MRKLKIDEDLAAGRCRPDPQTWPDDAVTLSWLGHASFLMNFFGSRILIDPAFFSGIGINPFGNRTIGSRRRIPVPLSIDEIGAMDLLLLTHAHSDHFDYPSLRRLQSEHTVAVTAKNTLPLWRTLRYRAIEELHWGERLNVDGLEILSVEGQHWGARMPWNKEMEANGYLLSKSGVQLFFAGDTGYTENFKQQLGGIPIHLAVFGIAAYSPKSFEAMHATPEQAWQMAEEIGARFVVPMHYGTFKMSREPMDEPLKRFLVEARNHPDKAVVLNVGETWSLPAVFSITK